MFPFQFSSINQSMLSQSPMDSLNLLWNQQAEKIKANSIMYMTPTFSFNGGWAFPEFSMYGNNLLNPALAIQQTMNSFQGGWMNGMNNGGFGNFNFGNMFSNNPWNFTVPWFSGNGGSNETVSNEYTALRNLIVKYKELGTKNNSLSPEVLDRINKALNQSGKPEEKMQALKDVYKTLNKTKLEKALLALDENKKSLLVTGYDMGSMDKSADLELTKKLNSLEQNLKSKKGDILAQVFASESESAVLRIISHWNDTRKDADERSILRLVAKNIPADESEQELFKSGTKNLTMSLINKVEDLKSELGGDYPKLDKAKDDVSKALSTAEAAFNEANVKALADKVETLYAMLRIMDAERIRNKIKTKYEFLNKIASDDKDFVNDDLIVKETKDDLASEGIKLNGIETDTVPVEETEEITDIDEKYDTAEEKVDALVKDEKALKKTAKAGVYTTTASTSNNPAHFYVIKDDKILELENVKAIDKDGNCTMIDGSKKSLEDAKKSTKEVTAQDIVDYNNTIERVDKLVKDGTLEKWKQFDWLKGEKLFKSKGLKENGRSQYFVIRDNKLVEINCDSLSAEGKAAFSDGTTKDFAKLEESDFREVENSDIVTTDKHAEAVKKAKEEEIKKDNDVIQKQLDTLITENVLRETYGKNPKIYYSENLKKHYMAKNGKLYELTDVSYINKKNQVITKAGKPVNPEQAAVKETSIKTIQDEVRNSGAQFGKQFADNVIGCSSGEQTKKAYDILDKNVNKYNIRYFIDAYTKEDTWYSDKICRQIMNEDDFKDKYLVIKRIISLVIQYCEDERLNLTSKEMQALKKIHNELTNNSNRLLSDNELKDIDKNILKVLNIGKDNN